MSALQQVIPEGYKQTEIGVIPEDWTVSKLNDVSLIRVGGDVDFIAFSLEQDSNFNYPVYSNTVDNPGVYGYYSYPEYSNTSVTVVGRGVGLGTAIVREGGFGAIGRLIVIEPQDLNEYFLASYINEHVKIQNESSGVPQLTGIALGNKQIPVPSRTEQTSIAHALSDVDALLSELENLIAKKQAIKTATMQQLLTGKTRLPQFAFYSDINSTEGAVEGMRKHSSATNVNAGACDEGSLASQESVGMDSRRKGTKPSELGEIPEDWDVISIANLTRNIIDYRGRTPKKLGLDWGGGDIVALSAGNVKKGYIDFEEGCYLGSEELYKKWMKNGAVEKDDIVFTMEAPLGNVALIPDTNRYILSQRTILIQLDRELFDPSFVYQLMMSVQFQSLLSDSATGSTAQGIKRARFEQLLLCLPKNIKEQTAIASILSDMDSEIQTLEQRLSKTRQIKQGMMQELLTGRTRLPFEQAIEA
ncbi:restriction endonuclease subunit S [Shewanella baltica]|uniref:restriction endonuclease subunit S n=1 Tax=Shewanella baltica TaxID=62322 RepID=UPI003CFC431B